MDIDHIVEHREEPHRAAKLIPEIVLRVHQQDVHIILVLRQGVDEIHQALFNAADAEAVAGKKDFFHIVSLRYSYSFS